MTEEYTQLCINRSLERAMQHKPFTSRVNIHTFQVDSISTTNFQHRVTLGFGGKLENAKCDCLAAHYVCCVHRAAAFLAFIRWLGTEQGQNWFLTQYLCYECGLLPRLENSEVCRGCAGEPKQAHIDQIAQDEADLFGAVLS